MFSHTPSDIVSIFFSGPACVFSRRDSNHRGFTDILASLFSLIGIVHIDGFLLVHFTWLLIHPFFVVMADFFSFLLVVTPQPSPRIIDHHFDMSFAILFVCTC